MAWDSYGLEGGKEGGVRAGMRKTESVQENRRFLMSGMREDAGAHSLRHDG